jgi:hypothetical protein
MTDAHLYFSDVSKSGQKTQTYVVCSRRDDAGLAEISWFVRWRRYVLKPYAEMIFDAECLNEIVLFINELMEERKKDAQR